MKLKSIVLSVFLAMGATASMEAQQPYTGCWLPDDIKNWSPETDSDAKFNRSQIPLAQRLKEPSLMKANKNQYYEGQVCNATILFNLCGSSPSQGANNFTGYQPGFWQYMDKVVYWAGSASEGIICPPPAYSIDAAHLNGVKILGNVFFPPHLFGGLDKWPQQMLTQENGKYIYAIKLYEIAKYFGFDGWFINRETPGTEPADWVPFFNEFYKAAEADGNTEMELQWYNASSKPQTDLLKANKNTSQFLEYGRTGRDYREYAAEINCSPEETFSKIYAGVECVKDGLTGYNYALNGAFPTTGHVHSLALFCPEEHAWKDNVNNILATPDAQGEKAYAAQQKTFTNEMNMWVNFAGDPSDISSTSWRGISGAVLERSTITTMPFASAFCNGLGKHRFVNGEKKGTQDWWNTGVQSILPTWRWWIENKGNLKVSEDWDDAYNFGSSYKITGSLSAGDHLMRLYKTMIPVSGGIFRIVYKANGGEIVPVVATESSVTAGQIALSNPQTKTVNGWTIAEYDLSSLNGKTIYMIALNLKAASAVSNYVANLGEIDLLPAAYSPKSVNLSNLSVNGNLNESHGSIRLTWDYDFNTDFDHFDIYTVTSNGESLAGQTRGCGYYIPSFDRNGTDASIGVKVVPVMKGGIEDTPIVENVAYPEPQEPTVSFKLSKSYGNVGEVITITANCTGFPSSYEWTVPESLEIISGQGTKDLTVKLLAEGSQTVGIKVANSVGQATLQAEVVDVFASGELKVFNVALNKTVSDYSSSTNAKETPKNIIDGDTNPDNISKKWCVDGKTDNWCIIDLGNVYHIYGFKLYDCNSGPESGENIPNYRIYTSNDGEEWTLQVDEKNRVKDDIKEDYIAPINARYVKLNTWSESNFVMRLWEFEVFGMVDSKMEINAPETLKVNVGETGNIIVSYNLNGEERDSHFICTATIERDNYVTIGNITENPEESTFSIPVTALKSMGRCDVVVRVNNGSVYQEKKVTVVIDNNENGNVLSGANARIRHYTKDYFMGSPDFETYSIADLTDGDTTNDALLDIERPSTHKEDLWVIFDAPGIWNLAKVKIHIPDANKAENDNGKNGFANKNITIRISDDGKNWVDVHTFSDLGEVSELEFILPQATETSYLAIVCDLNVYFYPTLAEVEAYEQYNNVLAHKAVETSFTQSTTETFKTGANLTDENEKSYMMIETGKKADTFTATINLESLHEIMKLEWVGTAKPASIEVTENGEDWTPVEGTINKTDMKLSDPVKATKIRFNFNIDKRDGITLYELYGYGKKHSNQNSEIGDCTASVKYDVSYDGNGNAIINYTIETNAEVSNLQAYKVGITDKDGIEIASATTQEGTISIEQQETQVVVYLNAFVVLNNDTKVVAQPENIEIKLDAYSGIAGVITDGESREIVAVYNLYGVQVENPVAGIYIVRYSDGTTDKLHIK